MRQMKHRQSTATEVSFDPSLYPRTYSVSRQNQWSWIAVGLVIAVGLPIQFWRSQALNSQPKVLFALLFVLAGGFLVLRALTLNLILEPDAVTVRGFFQVADCCGPRSRDGVRAAAEREKCSFRETTQRRPSRSPK
jgi:hypothetical protein